MCNLFLALIFVYQVEIEISGEDCKQFYVVGEIVNEFII